MESLIQPHEILGRQPEQDFRFEYRGFPFHKFMSACNVKIWDLPNSKFFVLLTDLGEGTSVTNASEAILTKLYREMFLPKAVSKNDIVFAEMYKTEPTEPIDLIIPSWDGDEVSDVDWKRIAQVQLS